MVVMNSANVFHSDKHTSVFITSLLIGRLFTAVINFSIAFGTAIQQYLRGSLRSSLQWNPIRGTLAHVTTTQAY
jgi:hypothetical protein